MSALSFPQEGYLGVLAEFADLYAQHYEPPKEFFYIDALALVGAALSGRVQVDIALPCQPRLYVCKIARTAWDRKSTSTRFAEQFVRSAFGDTPGMPQILRGVGSAEGLALALQDSPRVVLSFDELRRFEAKVSIQGSALLPMVNELFESNHYENQTKDYHIKVDEAQLTFISNTTEETWQRLRNAPEFTDIGFLNRNFLVNGSTDKRIPRPCRPAPQQIQTLVQDLAEKFKRLSPERVALTAGARNARSDGGAPSELVLPFTPEAEEVWDEWYCSLDQTKETARLDTIGPRLMAVLAFNAGKRAVDEEVMLATLSLLEYQRQVREALVPIIADNPNARMEQKIRRALTNRGRLTERDLRRHTHADRSGMEVFTKARVQLADAKEIRFTNGRWELVP